MTGELLTLFVYPGGKTTTEVKARGLVDETVA